MVGYWADFINPFSGQPYLNPHKNGTLYKTDERFRCLGFKIEQKSFCKIISIDSEHTNFIGEYNKVLIRINMNRKSISSYERNFSDFIRNHKCFICL